MRPENNQAVQSRAIALHGGGGMNQFSSAKILKHLDRVNEWRATGFSRPITYELDMTNVCNSKCPFCFGFYNQADDRSLLNIEEAKDIIRQIRNFGGKGITFTGGGEPLCNPATIEAVRYAKTIGLDVGFITNGILLEEKAARILVDSCVWIRVSLDAGTKKVYGITHGLNSNTFTRVVRNISLLVNKKKDRRSNVTIGTGFITYPEIIYDMPAFVRLSRKLGVDYAQFRPLLKSFKQKELNKKPDKTVIKIIEQCSKMSSPGFKVLCSVHKYGIMGNGEVKRAYGQCYGHNFATVVSANKKMYLCCHVRGIEKYCLGDLSKNTLSDIWRSARRKKAYMGINLNDCPLLCRCDGFNSVLWNILHGGEHINFL